MQEPDSPASSTLPAPESTPPVVRAASAARAPFSTLHTLSRVVLTILFYLTLADAAVETFVHGSPGRWITAGAVTAYAALTALLWRRSSWEIRAVASSLMLLFLLVLTAWLPDGVTQGIMLAGQPTSTVLTVAMALAVLLAGAALAGARVLPPPARWAAGIIAAYGTVAFLFGIVAGTPYADLFHGAGLWDRLPFWLQGPFVSAALVVPAAVIFLIITSLQRAGSRTALLGRRGMGVAALGAAVLVAVAGVRAPGNTGLAGIRTNTAESGYQLGPIVFARGESGGQPVDRADRFQEGIKALYAFFDFQGLKAEDTVKAIWFRGTNQLFEQSIKMSDVYRATPIPTKGRLWFSIKFDDGASAGGYSIKISVNDLPTRAEIVAVEPK